MMVTPLSIWEHPPTLWEKVVDALMFAVAALIVLIPVVFAAISEINP